MKRTSLALMVVAGAILLTASQTAAAAWYAKFDGVDGSVTHAGQGGWLEIQSASWATSPPTAPKAPAPAGVATGGPGRLTFVRKVDKASPLLQQAASKGRVFHEVQIQVLKAAQGQEAYLTYKLENVQITSYQLGATGGPAPSESLTLNFTKIEYKYSEQKAPGALKARPAVKQ